MKTPEEIKKGLETCIGECTGNKPHCPYHECGNGCMDTMNKNALAYIQQLEDGIDKTLKLVQSTDKQIREKLNELESRLAQAERERDAALKDIANTCWSCGNAKPSQLSKFLYSCPHLKGKGGVRTQCENWQWRGVCEENTKEENK